MADTDSFRDIHGLADQYDEALEKFRQGEWHIEANKQHILRFLRDCELGKTIKRGQKKRISKPRCFRLLGILKNLSTWLDKDFAEVAVQDMEDFIYEFENDRITQGNGKPYAKSTKCTIKKAIRKFWKWLKGENKFYPEEVDWIDTIEPNLDIPTISIEEVKQVIEAAKHTKTRAFIATLFETGARIGELMNLRPEDVTEDSDYGFLLVTIRHGTSKTKGRTVPIAIFKDELQLHINRLKAEKPDQEYLFDMNYHATLQLLHRLGHKVVGFALNNQIMRHSSATFFANNVETLAQLNHRYGWSMASKMAQRYVDRSGIQLLESAKRTVNNHATRKKADTEAIILRNRHLEMEVRNLRDKHQRIEAQLEVIVRYLQTTGKLKEIMGGEHVI